MAYISASGTVQDSKSSSWGLSTIPDMFWGFINFIVLFFQTMFSPDLTKKGNNYSSDYKPGDDRGGPRRRMGRPGNGGDGPSSPTNLPPGGG